MQPKVQNEFQNIRPWGFYQVSKKTKLCDGVWSMTVKLGNAQSVFSLDTGKHVMVRAMDSEGNFQSRCYTPITAKGTKGQFEMLIKVYPNGVMSTYLDQLAEGGYLQIQGPCGQVFYNKPGVVTYEGRELKCSKINLISGGLAVTTMYQFVQDVANRADDATKLSLVATFSNE